jgi:hypothetical protein
MELTEEEEEEGARELRCSSRSDRLSFISFFLSSPPFPPAGPLAAASIVGGGRLDLGAADCGTAGRVGFAGTAAPVGRACACEGGGGAHADRDWGIGGGGGAALNAGIAYGDGAALKALAAG